MKEDLLRNHWNR